MNQTTRNLNKALQLHFDDRKNGTKTLVEWFVLLSEEEREELNDKLNTLHEKYKKLLEDHGG